MNISYIIRGVIISVMHLFQMCRWYRPQKQLKLDITRAITVSSKEVATRVKNEE